MLVGKEGFCDFHSIQEAVDALERLPSGKAETLYILAGIYEAVRIYRSDLTIRGIGQVEITNNRYARQKDETGEEQGTLPLRPCFWVGAGWCWKT